MKKGIVALVGMIIGLVCLIVGFIGPWYNITASGGNNSLTMNYNMGLYLTRMDMKGTMMGQDVSASVSYADARNNPQFSGVNAASFAVIDTAMILTLLAIITGIIAVLGMAAFVFQKGKPTLMKLLGGVFGLLTFVLAIAPALYFWLTGFSSASTAAQGSTSFWFSVTVMGISMSGGPGYAWYLMLVAAIIALIAAVAILLKKIQPEGTATGAVVPPSI